MKKAGILTFHRADNYGAVLQCYAMQEYLRKNGIDAGVVDYTNERILGMYKSYISLFDTYKKYKTINLKFTFLRALKTYFNNIYFLGKYKKHNAFETFRKKYMNLSKKCKDYSQFLTQSADYDMLFVGSDQIWNKKMYGGNYDPVYFLEGVSPKVARISYAASAGDTIPEEDTCKVKKFLENFDYISTRETSLAEQLTDVTGRECFGVLDPVFLLKYEEWEKLLLTKNPYKKEKYILSYNISADASVEEYMSKVDSVAEKLNLKVYEISKKRHSKKEGKNFSSVGPEEFLQLIAGAEFVYTSSFHTLAFSIIFNKEFNVFIPSYATRVKNLLDFLELNRKIICPGQSPDYSPIDYNAVKDKISKKLLQSEEFIKKAITQQ